MYYLYNILILLFSPIWVPWMWWRSNRRAEKPNCKERTGNYVDIKIPKDQPSIWFHAVSVGEVVAALPILRQLKALLPGHYILLTVTTSSGHSTAMEHGVDAFDRVAYFPIDMARFQLSAMMRIKPDVVAIMETELWYNFLWSAKVIGATTMLINGRISDRSFPRSMKFRFFYSKLLAYMDRCLMQSETDAERIKALGANSAEVFGNVKFDQAIGGLSADPIWWKEMLGLDPSLPTVVVGSSRGEEDESIILAGLEKVGRKFNLVWAPRHIERAEALTTSLQKSFGSAARRSLMERGSIVVLDTYGELAKVYSVADLVVIGGSFADLGGQNIIQPLAHGKPVLHGRYMQNFREATSAAKRVGVSVECEGSEELATNVRLLLDDASGRAKMGSAGVELVKENEGAARRYAQAIADAANQ